MQKVIDAAAEYGQAEFQRGLKAGIAVAEKYLLWLDNANKKDLRRWLLAEIAATKAKR